MTGVGTEVVQQVTLRAPSNQLRWWHQALATRPQALLHMVPRVEPAPPERDVPGSRGVLRVERILNRLPARELVPPTIPLAGDGPLGLGEPSQGVEIDLTADPVPGSWTVRYDGRHGQAAAVGALLAGHQPYVEVVDGQGHVRAAGRPGSDHPGILSATLPDLLAGVVTLVAAATAGHSLAAPLASSPGGAERPPRPTALLTSRVAGALLHQTYRTLFRAPHWRVGWRPVPAQETPGHAPAWRLLPDDGRHFYADPFPFEHDGRTHVFVEDFDHRQGKAVISAVEIGPEGPVGTPVCVLEHEVHLSYPFVFAHAGDVWMIPETSGAGTVELYRAVAYPYRWELDRVLLEGVEAGDATPFRHGGRWWLSATVRVGGSCSDSLYLWSAADLRGPWHPHRHNPVLVDVSGARPAGRVLELGGRLVRPVQDCRQGYGRAVHLFEILRLDDEGFEQRLVGRLRPGAAWPGSRLHTWNRAGGLECIDGSRLVPRSDLVYRALAPRMERAMDETSVHGDPGSPISAAGASTGAYDRGTPLGGVTRT